MNIEKDIKELDAKLVEYQETYKNISEQMAELERQFTELRTKRDEVAVQFAVDQKLQEKLKGYLSEDVTK